MESTIALALMVKATKVFKSDDSGDSSLSFPFSPVPFKKGDLDFASGDLTNEQALSLSEFSRIVNLIPEGIFWDSAERYLWREYQDVLYGSVKLASSIRSPEAEADYQKALQVLRMVKGNGAMQDTPAVVAYNQYRDAWFMAVEDFNNKKSEAESSADPAVHDRWTKTDEPLFRERIKSIETDWEIKGFRTQVESAQQTVALLGSQDAHRSWTDWKARYQPILDEKKDTNDMGYAWSGFTPSNALDVGSWLHFTLTADEANKLIKEAPAELRARLGPNPVSFDIESLSFEYSCVKVIRPWFDSEVFKSRFWRFYDGSKLVSDGVNPAIGSCPLYVTALVFARKLEIKLKENSSTNDEALKRLAAQKTLSLGFIKLAAPIATPAPHVSPLISNASLAASVKIAQPAVVAGQPVRAAMVDVHAANIAAGALKISGVSPTIKGVAISPVATKPSKSAGIAQLQTKVFTRIPLPDVKRPPDTPPPPPTAPVADDDELYVMAFICKRVPRSPDPDPNLQWQ